MDWRSAPRIRKTHCSVCGCLLDPGRPKAEWGKCLPCRRAADNVRRKIKRTEQSVGVAKKRLRAVNCTRCRCKLDPNRPQGDYGLCSFCRLLVDRERHRKLRGWPPRRMESEDMGPLRRGEIIKRIGQAGAWKAEHRGAALPDMFFGPNDQIVIRQH